jgi:hypothetical protein
MLKEMMSLSLGSNDQINVKINYSSLDILQSCLKKAEYYFVHNLRGDNHSPALIFGSAIHKAMEVWYSSKLEHRHPHSVECVDFQNSIENMGVVPPGHDACARCATVYAFIDAARTLGLPSCENPGARTISKGVEILNAFCTERLHDDLSVVYDTHGPIIERYFEFPIAESKTAKITYFGTIDLVLKDEKGRLYVCDHKTTQSFGKDFFNRISPNFQYTGYVLGAVQSLGLDVSDFLVNGIQVTKTLAPAFVRQTVTIGPEQFAELEAAVLFWVSSYAQCSQLNAFPQSCPNSCCMWGGCSYQDLCIAPLAVREKMIEERASLVEESASPIESVVLPEVANAPIN